MASQKTKSPALAGDDRNLVQVDETYAAASFEDKARLFWGKYSRIVWALIVIAMLLIVSRWVMATLAARHDEKVQRAYQTATTDEARRQFAKENSRHVLGAAASLELADAAYSKADYTAALAAYNEAAASLAGTPFAARARLGAAMSQVLGGQTEAGQKSLRLLSDDINLSAPIRAEAAYHLAVLLRDAGKTEDAGKLAEQIFSIAPSSVWAQRGMMLKAQLPAAPAADTAPAATATGEATSTPVIAFPAPAANP
ncbi:hypothetical protein Ga0100231_009280 [Opitutaceae bacterium TAV4]|uniref:hypothetical protein n=1 Tax=Geminisphaera colitermitum TaxID=1148786 RepID=UPI000158CF96|nr:hypothetical protein [Geminisphaera colitermitum]RRJ94513.1 hypothetical protein Ga0100231_009280 [Opitutaceae bacterium TAV4]